MIGGKAAVMVLVEAGAWRPVYPPSPEETEIRVAAFRLDEVPVTNAAFLSFVREHPRWRRDRVSRLYADEGYLSHWGGLDELGTAGPAQPVTQVSWFAARAYCAHRGARLPTVAEWELAASAGTTTPDASLDEQFRDEILGWYARPSPAVLPDVGHGPPNWWGARDLHGLVWEWVEDFNDAMVSADNREGKGADRLAFCGSATLGAEEKGDYASFMRIAMRSALRASYTVSSLGFRCASS